jgi:dihydroorotase
LHDYNTLLKVFPPLRTKIDQLALQKAVVEGVVDCISAHHIPQDWDAKTIEFENAKAGIASIETSFAAVNHILPQLSESQLSALFSSNARNIFKLPMVCIQEGQLADLTFYSTQRITNLTRNESKSKSANSPFWNIPLQGKIIGTYVKGKLNLNK